MRLETRYARSGDVNIAYQVVGDGRPGSTSSSSWAGSPTSTTSGRSRASPASCAGWPRSPRLILFDKRGTGLSDRCRSRAAHARAADGRRAGGDGRGRLGARRPVRRLRGRGRCAPLRRHLPRAHHRAGDRSAPTPGGSGRPTTRGRRPPRSGSLPASASTAPGAIDEAWSDARAEPGARRPAFRDMVGTYLRMGASPGAAVALTRMNAAGRHPARPAEPSACRRSSCTAPATVAPGRGGPLRRRAHPRRPLRRAAGQRPPAVRRRPGRPPRRDRGVPHRRAAGAEPDRVLATVSPWRWWRRPRRPRRSATGAGAGPSRPTGRCVRQELGRFRGAADRGRPATGVVATFDGPARAMRCASAVVEAARGLGLAVRAGVHTGECEVLATTVTAGSPSTRRRGPGAGRPGDVLVSSTVKDLVAGAGLAFEGQGTHRFEGCPASGACSVSKRGRGRAPAARPLRLVVPRSRPPRTATSTSATSGSRAGRGPTRLTPREREVAALLARGLTNRQIPGPGDHRGDRRAARDQHPQQAGLPLARQVAAWAAEQGLHRARFGYARPRASAGAGETTRRTRFAVPKLHTPVHGFQDARASAPA